MSDTIKLRLDHEEYVPVARLAEQLHVTPETIAYAGLNHIMEHPDLHKEIGNLHLGRDQGLPRWADGARGVHIYECKHDE
jgi:hypothetical protein